MTFRISIDLYVNDVMSAHELSNVYTRPVTSNVAQVIIPEDLQLAHETLVSARNLKLILISKSIQNTLFLSVTWLRYIYIGKMK